VEKILAVVSMKFLRSPFSTLAARCFADTARVALTLLLTFFLSVKPAIASPDGAVIFENNCAGCHVNGGNIMRRGKNLKLKALQKNGVDSVEAIAQLVTHGKGLMSAYGDRLSVEEIAEVSKYVTEQAKQDWKKG
jgi:cytochrome c6